MIKSIKEIQSIESYNSAYEALKENTDPAFFEEHNIDDDDICFLSHFDDWDGYAYYVINYDYVLITLSGDVEGNMLTLEEFSNELLKLLEEDRREREQ